MEERLNMPAPISLATGQILTADGRSFATATLHAPASLNALSLDMIRRLTHALSAWRDDPRVVGVVLQGAGERAFCAGGDLRELYESMRRYGDAPNPVAQAFFGEEYRLDYTVHTYPKPILGIGRGIVMGGGIGLFAGCSQRIVTDTSRLAMPEITVGLYPDVGGSWILRRMPGRTGLFLALTGASLNAADAMFVGLADAHVESLRVQPLLEEIAAISWRTDPRENKALLARISNAAASVPLQPSRIREHYDEIQALMAGEDLNAIAERLRKFDHADPWLVQAAQAFRSGSPTSAALAFELWHQVLHLSLADAFRLEYRASLGCCAHPDFAEGIRALLVDKDRAPKWTPPSLEEVTPAWIRSHFEERFAGPDPLVALGREIMEAFA
jgi:enoyl-CoA hydratase/carnithine racemase